MSNRSVIQRLRRGRRPAPQSDAGGGPCVRGRRESVRSLARRSGWRSLGGWFLPKPHSGGGRRSHRTAHQPQTAVGAQAAAWPVPHNGSVAGKAVVASHQLRRGLIAGPVQSSRRGDIQDPGCGGSHERDWHRHIAERRGDRRGAGAAGLSAGGLRHAEDHAGFRHLLRQQAGRAGRRHGGSFRATRAAPCRTSAARAVRRPISSSSTTVERGAKSRSTSEGQAAGRARRSTNASDR